MAQPERFPKLHRDGTVSFWSYGTQDWVQHAFHVPMEELERMHTYDQERVRKHLRYDALVEPS